MNKLKWMVSLCFLLGCLLVFLSFFAKPQSKSQETLATRINLAIRQTVHNLHVIAEDSISKIPAVEQTASNTYQIKIEKNINYDTLPAVLNASLQDFSIGQKYMVSLKSCENEEILLGYNWLSLENNNVACAGRSRSHDCSILQLTLEEVNQANLPYLPIAFLSFILGSLGVFVFLFLSKKNKNRTVKSGTSNKTSEGIKIGNSFFQPQNLSIQTGEKSKSLTFRESKLLEYFALRPNQVLKRENIQDAVWSEEGIIVGRSLDVFISRLRKILKDDKLLAIKNIHGVGYRLEVK